MKTFLLIMGALFCAFLILFFFCACRLASEADRREEAMFAHWFAEHTDDSETEDAVQ